MLSRYRFRAAAYGTAGLLVLLCAGAVRAQRPVHPQMRPQLVDATGTVEMVGPGWIGMKTAAGSAWMLQITPQTTVLLTGTAKPDVLARGQCIRFIAEVDKRRSKVQDKVDKLIVFTPSPERQLGVFPDQGGLGAAAGPNPFGQAPGLGQTPAAGRSPGKARDTGPPVESFEIAGQISGIKKGKFTILAPNPYFKPILEIELTEDPEIELDLAGPNLYTFAKKGDKIEARGSQIGRTAALVSEMTIELAEPLTTVQPKKTPPKRRARTSRSRRAARAEKADEGEEADDDEETDEEDEDEDDEDDEDEQEEEAEKADEDEVKK